LPFASPACIRVPSSSPGGAGGGSVSTLGSTSVFCSDGSGGMVVSLDEKSGDDSLEPPPLRLA
jgi:hypothetical protein